jgi:transposase-like protein
LSLKDKINSKDTLELIEELEEKPKCVYCGSENIIKRGIRKNKNGAKQRYLCKNCNRRFVYDAFKRMKVNGKIVTLVMDLYYKGLSLRDIADTIYQFYGIKLHHETVRIWILRFTKIMNDFVKKLKPKVSGIWHTDEQMVKVKGKWLWSWNCLDEETRFLLANAITENRNIEDARLVFQKAKETAKGRPELIVTDGLWSYEKAVKKEFSTWRLPRTLHIRLESVRAKRNNNLIERYHSTFRERDKVMRGFKAKRTAKELTEGFRTYYNFIRKHHSLNGLTPSQKAEIDLQLDRNRWLSLLKKSMENTQVPMVDKNIRSPED